MGPGGVITSYSIHYTKLYDPGVDILSIAAKYKIEDEFPEEVIKEIEALPDHILEKEYIGRRDLRNDMIFTIDGDDTKDIDDAVSVVKLDNGNYKLGVHIADVSYYVRDRITSYNVCYTKLLRSLVSA